MLNATEAETAFLAAINSGKRLAEIDTAVAAVVSEFHEFLIHTYAQDIPAVVEPRLWYLAWLQGEDKSYADVERDYRNEAAIS